MNEIERLLADADSLYYESEFEQAVAQYSKALEIDETHSGAYEGRGLAWYSLSDIDRSYADMSKAILHDEENHNALFNRGLILLEKKDPANALKDLEQAIAIYGDSFDYLGYCLTACLAVKDYDKIMIYADRLLEIAPKAAMGMMAKADVFLFRQDYKNALRIYLSMLEEDENNASIHSNIGYTLMKAEEYKVAIPYFDKAMEINKELAYPYSHKGWCEFKLGKKDEGLANIEHAIILDNNYANAFKNKGLILKSEGEIELAILSFEAAIDAGYTEQHGDDVQVLLNELKEKTA